MENKEEYRTIKIIRQCPRFERCSVPICPLDLFQDERDRLPCEPKCTLGKKRRFLIGRETSLPRKGLTSREWSARQRYNSLSEEEKDRMKNRARNQLKLNQNRELEGLLSDKPRNTEVK